MADSEFTRGDVVYSIDGDQAEYVAAIPDGHVVLPMYGYGDDSDDAPPWSGEAATWGRVFAQPPVPVFHEESAKARAELERLTKQIDERRNELRELQRGDSERLARLKQHQYLARIDDWLAGKITHFVAWERYSDRIKVESFEKVMTKGERRSAHEVPLLVLYGSLETDYEIHRTKIEWCRMSDGDALRLIPCNSEEEARVQAQHAMGFALEKWRASAKQYADSWYQSSTPIYLAQDMAALGMPLPADVIAARDRLVKYNAAAALEGARKKADEAQRELQKAEAAAIAAQGSAS